MEFSEIERAVEAVLFASGDPVEIGRLCAIFETEESALVKIITQLKDRYDFEQRGIRIVKLENAYQMCSAPAHADFVRKALETRRAPRLSPALLEVLSVIAYRQPVTRAYVEQVRGVDCTYSINSLLEKALIKESGRLDVPGKPILYRTTKDFLRVFGLESLADLPELPELLEQDDAQVTFSELALQEEGEAAPNEQNEIEG